jgi:hypothetical protein
VGELPIRIQRSRAKGWKMPANAIYVGRNTLWGNPFKVGAPSGVFTYPDETKIAALTVEQSIEFYRTALSGTLTPEMHPAGHTWIKEWRRRRSVYPSEWLRDLRGHNLCCWCALDQPCHADVLLELANAMTTARARRG